MKPTRWFSAIFFFALSIALAGCYTHLATSDQGYYVYHAPRPYYSDTIRANSSLEKPLVVYDTTMHGDTMFIDERQVPAAQAENAAPGEAAAGTVINNYYGPGSYWDDYWGPSWGFSIGIGWPYYHSLWPYYDYSWYQPFGYFGAYPPFFDCYAPFYSPYYAGFYSPYYGGYYGHGFHDHGFHDGFGGNPYDGFRRNIRPGRIGGEYRAGSITSPATQPASMIGRTNFSNPSTTGLTATELTREENSSVAETNAADELRSSADRNAPMHVVGPDASAGISRASSTDARTDARGYDASANSQVERTMTAPSANNFANTSARPIVVRRMDGQTITTSTASTQSGRQMVVVRRSAGYSSRGYNSPSRGYNSSSRSYNSSSRSYSAPARNSNGPSRSYSAPARSYSAPAERNSGGGYSSGRSGGGEVSSGGGERSGGG
ncbi:MAG TPA: hypothetical protein VFX22_06905, partial [Candidatus Kapabacteria bacterium]|nr:hypothetical protein [Candidatus Kapabacteria bacterium]